MYPLDRALLDLDELHARKFELGVGLLVNLVAREDTIAVGGESLEMVGLDVLAVRTALPEISCPVDVVVHRTVENEIVAQQLFQRLPVFCLVAGIVFSDEVEAIHVFSFLVCRCCGDARNAA